MRDHKDTRGRGVDKYPVGENSDLSDLYKQLEPVHIVDVYDVDAALCAAVGIGVHKFLKRTGVYRFFKRVIRKKIINLNF